MGTPKKSPGKLPVATVKKRGAKNGSSTRKPAKPRSTRRYCEIKIRIPMEDFARGQPYFHEERYLSRFVLDAYLERVTRAEANNKSARVRKLAGDIELLLPIIKEMYQQGKLTFLNVQTRGEQ